MPFDSAAIFSQLRALKAKESSPVGLEEAAAVAASQADALIDSLQMPRFAGPIPNAVDVVPSSSASESSNVEKTEIVSGDEESDAGNETTVTTAAAPTTTVA